METFDVKPASAWIGMFVGLIGVSAFAAEGRYFQSISTLCLSILLLVGFSGTLILLGEIRDQEPDM